MSPTRRCPVEVSATTKPTSPGMNQGAASTIHRHGPDKRLDGPAGLALLVDDAHPQQELAGRCAGEALDQHVDDDEPADREQVQDGGVGRAVEEVGVAVQLGAHARDVCVLELLARVAERVLHGELREQQEQQAEVDDAVEDPGDGASSRSPRSDRGPERRRTESAPACTAFRARWGRSSARSTKRTEPANSVVA